MEHTSNRKREVLHLSIILCPYIELEVAINLPFRMIYSTSYFHLGETLILFRLVSWPIIVRVTCRLLNTLQKVSKKLHKTEIENNRKQFIFKDPVIQSSRDPFYPSIEHLTRPTKLSQALLAELRFPS